MTRDTQSSVQKRVHKAIASALERAQVKLGAKVVLGLSGGPDSVALLHALLDLKPRFKYELAAAHLNHRIRDAQESDRDEQFVRDKCAALGVELVVENADGLDADLPNLEERARDARHAFLRRAAGIVGAEFIALAHHGDDQAETVLMRLIRGAGAAGLAAMAERGPGKLIRPMLALTRIEVLDYLRARGIDFVNDSTNLSTAILRNRIRTKLLPMLERDYAPGIRARLPGLAAEMRSLDDLVTRLAAHELETMRIRDGAALDVGHFSAIDPAVQASVIRLYLAERMGGLRKITRAHLESVRRLILEGGPSAGVNIANSWRVEREYNLIRVVRSPIRLLSESKSAKPEFSVPLDLDGVTAVAAAGFEFEASTLAAADVSMPENLSVALFDAAKIGDSEVVVRNFLAGDRIRPVGMLGARKVKDVFIDRKLPRARRSRYPVVTLAGEVAWVPGLARSRCALVTKATETILRVEARENIA